MKFVLEPTPRTTRILRIGMLGMIAIVALENAAGWVDADLWIPFVCIIAVMGVGTRGGPVDALGFVLIEASVVALLGVATFTGSRDGVWAASVAVSVIAIGKIALVEMHRRDLATEAEARLRKPSPLPRGPTSTTLRTQALTSDSQASRSMAQPEPLETGMREASPAREAPSVREEPVIPRTRSELPPAPILPAPPISLRAPKVSEDAGDSGVSPTPPPKKKRDRNDPTPRAVPLDRPR